MSEEELIALEEAMLAEAVMAEVTCHTPDCMNAGIAIELAVHGPVICGPCSQEITDVQPLLDLAP